MAIFNRKRSVTITGNNVRSVWSAADPDPAEKAKSEIEKALDFLESGLTPADVYGVDGADLQLASEYGLSFFNESARYAVWQKLVTPWLQSPGMVAIMNKVCNKIASLPTCQINIETGEKKPLPKIFDMPLGTDNPSFNQRQYWKQFIGSMYRFGDGISHLKADGDRKVLRMTPTSAERVRINAPIYRPTYDFYAGAVSIVGTNPTKGQFVAEGVPASQVLHVSNMAAPETLRGVPIGLMISQNVAAILGSQDYTARFFSDANWQQTLFTPPYQMEDFSNYKKQFEELLKATKANHSTIATDAPVNVQRIGMNAQEAMLDQMMKSSQQILAVSHNVPYGMIAPENTSHAQLYVESQMFVSDVAEPIVEDVADEHSRLLEPGWRVHFETTKLWDPKTLLDMLTQANKAGMTSVNRACQMLGWEPFGDISDESNIFNRPTCDGNRVPVDMLEQIAENKAKPKPAPGSPGGDKAPEREEPPEPSDTKEESE